MVEGGGVEWRGVEGMWRVERRGRVEWVEVRGWWR